MLSKRNKNIFMGIFVFIMALGLIGPSILSIFNNNVQNRQTNPGNNITNQESGASNYNQSSTVATSTNRR